MSAILDTQPSLLGMDWARMRKYFSFLSAPSTDKSRFASSCTCVIEQSAAHLILLTSKETSPAEESRSGDDQIVLKRHS